MNSAYKKSTERDAILRALQAPPARGYFVWDKKNEDERPATVQELDAGIAATRKRVDRSRRIVFFRSLAALKQHKSAFP